MFTSGIVSIGEGYRIGLYLNGRKHPGENLAKVLKQLLADQQQGEIALAGCGKTPLFVEISPGRCFVDRRITHLQDLLSASFGDERVFPQPARNPWRASTAVEVVPGSFCFSRLACPFRPDSTLT
jgi:hypothetical protein